MSGWSTERFTRRGGKGRAFLLIELLVVVGIIALLVAILLPSFTHAREAGKRRGPVVQPCAILRRK